MIHSAPYQSFQGATASWKSSTPSSVLKTLTLRKLCTNTAGNFKLIRIYCSFYNKTKYSGLETHILNSYTNPVLQAMHYILPLRQLAKSHIAFDCPLEHCLLCELGFVVRNLEEGKGTNCHAGNFCKTLGLLAQGHPHSQHKCV